MSRTSPPSGGYPPPTGATLDDAPVDLIELASEVCDRYYLEFTDEHERYGDAGVLWCRHDNQWLLSWAIGDALGYLQLNEQAAWLAQVLHARNFPIDRLVRDLEIAADVAAQQIAGPTAPKVSDALRQAAAHVKSLTLDSSPPAFPHKRST